MQRCKNGKNRSREGKRFQDSICAKTPSVCNFGCRFFGVELFGSLTLGCSFSLTNLLELHIQLLQSGLQARTLAEIERFDGVTGLVHGRESRAADCSGGVLEEAARECAWSRFGEG